MKMVDYKQLAEQAKELRVMIVKRASENSGHLASPLGVVELTQALLAVYNFKQDKIVFDVGHQAHAYKILTGRKDSYFSMSKMGGMRAYPDIHESEFDFYGVGHTSTSISAALGYSIGHPEYKSIAVVGDGSLTGGETFEGINHAGDLKTNILVIYNDNGMSLVENVGALHDKKRVKGFAESLGFEYVGVIDGHDTKKLVKTLSEIKEKKLPIFLHVQTIKGKGYEFAEKNPSTFHWPAPFHVKTGKPRFTSTGDSWFAHNDKKGKEYIKKYKDLYFTTPALVGWGLGGIKKEYPNNVIDTGINEQHCVTFSSALALAGNKVLCYIPSTFLARAFDQVIDVCLQRIPMVFVLTFPGIADGGYTHQGIYTFPMVNMLPTATIMHPCGFDEFDRMLDEAVASKKTVFIQSPDENISVKGFNGTMTEIKSGNKVTILPLGNMMQKAITVADNIGDVEVLYAPTIKPFDSATLAKHVKKTGKLLILEDGFVRGGIGEGIARDLHELGVTFEYTHLGVRDIFPEQGSMEDVYNYVGLSDEHIEKAVKKLITT